MAWIAFDHRSLRSLEKSPTISKAGVTLREGNALTEALARKESILLLPGTEPESPFLLHIRNRRDAKPQKKK
jgi:hypothetical protein